MITLSNDWYCCSLEYSSIPSKKSCLPYQAYKGKKAALHETLEDTEVFLVEKMHPNSVLPTREGDFRVADVPSGCKCWCEESSAHSRKERKEILAVTAETSGHPDRCVERGQWGRFTSKSRASMQTKQPWEILTGDPGQPLSKECPSGAESGVSACPAWDLQQKVTPLLQLLTNFLKAFRKKDLKILTQPKGWSDISHNYTILTGNVCALKLSLKMLNLFTDVRVHIMAIQNNTAQVQAGQWKRKRKNWKFLALLTIAIFKDDPYKISSKHFVVVHYPERLHFRIHISTLLNTRRKHNRSCSQIDVIQLERSKHGSEHKRTCRLPVWKHLNALFAFILLLCHEHSTSHEHICYMWNVFDYDWWMYLCCLNQAASFSEKNLFFISFPSNF